jgi:hypothetical protein
MGDEIGGQFDDATWQFDDSPELLKALTTQVFTTMLAVNRFEGQTREDNVAMQDVRACRVREAGPLPGGLARRERPRTGLGGLQHPET